MEHLSNSLKAAAKLYNKGREFLPAVEEVADIAVGMLSAEEITRDDNWGFRSNRNSGNVRYRVFSIGSQLSRPWRHDMAIEGLDDFHTLRREAMQALEAGFAAPPEAAEVISRYIYATVMSVACCYDLWKPGSRKTPGTFFEVLMAGLFQAAMPHHQLLKHIDLGNLLGTGSAEDAGDAVAEEAEKSSLSTDLVIQSASGRCAVIPLKITTRERVVQPFAHQRILAEAFPGKYESFLCCISETQLDKVGGRLGVHQVCVPGTVRLFARFMARMEGMYYGDIPYRYSQPDLTRVVPVKTIGSVFSDVRAYLER